MKHCPHCDGLIQDGAIKCKHCKQFIPRGSENIFRNIAMEEVEQKLEDIIIQDDYKNKWWKNILQEEKVQVDIGKIVAISVISVSVFILFVYMLVSFAKTQNIENRTNNNLSPVAVEKPKETTTKVESQIVNQPQKTEIKPVEKPKEEKKWIIKKVLQDVNLRSESTSSSEKIHTIYEWDEVEVLGKITNSQWYLWYKVKHEWVEGWISYVGFEKKEEEKKSKNKSEITLDDFYNKTIYGEYYEYWPQFYIVTSKNNKDLWDCDYRVVTQYKIKTSMKEGILVPAESRTTTRKYAFTQDMPDVVDKTCTYLGTGPINAQIVWESVWF